MICDDIYVVTYRGMSHAVFSACYKTRHISRSTMIRVLVADDSVTVRAQLVRLFGSDPELTVIGEAGDGQQAVVMAQRLRPDVIVMDVMMPRLDGFEATKRIMFDAPAPVVLVSSQFASREVALSLEALRVGAVHAVSKPAHLGTTESDEETRKFVRMIKSMATVKVVRRRSLPAPNEETRDVAALSMDLPRAPVRIVAMGASTGGPAALHRILAPLPKDLAVPILVVQHIPAGFVADFARWLDAASALHVKVAEDGEPLLPATVYIAPPDRHLGVRGGTIALSLAPPVDGFRPSATHLFESVAQAFGATSLAILLTGMGHDGVAGLRRIQALKGTIVTQDEATCVVYGMPGVAVGAGLGGTSLPLDAIAAYIVRATYGGPDARKR